MRKKEPPKIDWETYMLAPVNQARLDGCRMACGPALAEQRESIGRLIEAKQPKQIAFLGSGYLNDIPVEALFEEGRKNFLVDWIPKVSQEGLKGSLIDCKQGNYRCLFCEHENPSQYCKAFKGPMMKPDGVCGAFCIVEEPFLYCENYIPGAEPTFITQDITSGRAARFAERIGGVVNASHAPEQAFRKAIHECKKCANVYDELPIFSDSLDLVTSSMVVSQFDSEPYLYFSKLLELEFGRDRIFRKEKILLPLMEVLRKTLFKIQMDGHVKELYRLVNKAQGNVYFSVELFRSLPERDEFFLVHEMPYVLNILSDYFFFDFTLFPLESTLKRMEIGEGSSVIQSYVLTPRDDIG